MEKNALWVCAALLIAIGGCVMKNDDGTRDRDEGARGDTPGLPGLDDRDDDCMCVFALGDREFPTQCDNSVCFGGERWTCTGHGQAEVTGGCGDVDGTVYQTCNVRERGVVPKTDVGLGVFEGSTRDRPNEFASECGGEGSPDVAFAWRPPSPGTYRFDTHGSTFDTVLSVVPCSVGILCDDDTVGSTSEVVVDLPVVEDVVVIVDGYDGEAGSYYVNVRKVD